MKQPWVYMCSPSRSPPYGSYYDYMTHIIKNHLGTLKKNKIYYTGGYTACLGPHSKITRERERQYGSRVQSLLGVKVGVPRVSQVYYLGN